MTPHDSEFTLPVADVSLTPLERGTRALAKSPRKKQKIADSGNLNTQATRTNYKKVKGKRGRLKLMTEIPMDILLEIFSHLQPVDVLHLSRVSRRLRDLLTSSNIRYIWTSVYENIALSLQPPACPSDVDIIHYTNYLFGRHCQLCARNFGQVRHESALIRVCSNCAKTEFCSLRKLDLDCSVKYLCIPWIIPKYGRRILRTEYNLRQREKSQAAVENRLPQYVNDRRSAIALRKTHGDVLQSWRRDVRVSKEAERQKILSKRQDDIRQKITDEGLGNLLTGWMKELPHVLKAKELTDSEWKRIRPEIIATLQLQEERTLEFARELGLLDFSFELPVVPLCYSADLDFEKEFGEWFNG